MNCIVFVLYLCFFVYDAVKLSLSIDIIMMQ